MMTHRLSDVCICVTCMDSRALARELAASQREKATTIYWLLRAYDAGHRHGWEEGPSNTETMDGLHAFLCNVGYDPNTPETRAWLLHRSIIPTN